MAPITPRQCDMDNLIIRLWRARVWLNEQRRRAYKAPATVPRLIQKLPRVQP